MFNKLIGYLHVVLVIITFMICGLTDLILTPILVVVRAVWVGVQMSWLVAGMACDPWQSNVDQVKQNGRFTGLNKTPFNHEEVGHDQ